MEHAMEEVAAVEGQLLLAMEDWESFADSWDRLVINRLNGGIECRYQPMEAHGEWLLGAGGAVTTSITASRPLYVRDREEWERDDIASETEAFLPCNEPTGGAARVRR